MIFEHRTYLPSYGLFLILSTVIIGILGNRYRVHSTVIMVIIVIIYSFLTYERNKVWKDELTLWSDNASKTPHLARPFCNRGYAYSKLDQWKPALADYTRALEIDPDYVDALSNRGGAYGKLGQWDKTVTDCSAAIRI